MFSHRCACEGEPVQVGGCQAKSCMPGNSLPGVILRLAEALDYVLAHVDGAWHAATRGAWAAAVPVGTQWQGLRNTAPAGRPRRLRPLALGGVLRRGRLIWLLRTGICRCYSSCSGASWPLRRRPPQARLLPPVRRRCCRLTGLRGRCGMSIYILTTSALLAARRPWSIHWQYPPILLHKAAISSHPMA